MYVRKPVDYSAMFAALDALMAADLLQMKLYCEIGQLVSSRAEKGATVAAAEHLRAAYPDASGFSPRNLRRMRGFYCAYENASEVLAEAMTIGWTQNVVILEAGLSLQEQTWYIQAARQFGWSKMELQQKITAKSWLYGIIGIKGERPLFVGNVVRGFSLETKPIPSFGIACTHNLSDFHTFVPTPNPRKGRVEKKKSDFLATPNRKMGRGSKKSGFFQG